MAKEEITYNQLWLVQEDIERLNIESPAIALFQKSRFERFLKANRNELYLMHRRMQKIQLKYIEHNSDVEPLKTEAGDWKYLDSVVAANGQLLTGDAVKEAYLEEANSFLKRKISVEI